MLDRPGVELSGEELRLGGSNAVLVEFPRHGVPPRAAEELHRLRIGGVVPVLAHPERYFGCSVSQVRDWRAAGAVMQGDATMLLGKHEKGKLSRALLEHGLLDVLAADNHGDQRTVRAARDWLVGVGATTQATLLTTTNPARLLAGQPLEPVPPATVEQGVLRRLRELLLGRA
jgi:protein-tyrosine phosphatase